MWVGRRMNWWRCVLSGSGQICVAAPHFLCVLASEGVRDVSSSEGCVLGNLSTGAGLGCIMAICGAHLICIYVH